MVILIGGMRYVCRRYVNLDCKIGLCTFLRDVSSMVEEDWELSPLLQLTFVRRRYFRQFWGIVKLVDVYIKKEKIIEKMFR